MFRKRKIIWKLLFFLVVCFILLFYVDITDTKDSREAVAVTSSSKTVTGSAPPTKASTPQGPKGLKVVYASIDHCKKPAYNPDYSALCYNSKNITNYKGVGSLDCIANHHLIGIRKCGTTDVIKWFQYHQKNTKLQVKGDNIQMSIKCPFDYYKGESIADPGMQKDVMRYSPGNILFSGVRGRNDTHLIIQTTIQYLAFLDDPEKSKYLLTLRNPTDRLISYLFHAHKQKWIYRNVATSNFNATLVHTIVISLLEKVKTCLLKNGELACVYMYNSRDGNLDPVIQHGMYVVYIEELFKFIPRERIYINQLEEYSLDQLQMAGKMVEFFGRKLDITEETIATSHKSRNKGTKTGVLPETLSKLDKFYRHYNQRLATLLGDKKWLYNRKAKQS